MPALKNYPILNILREESTLLYLLFITIPILLPIDPRTWLAYLALYLDLTCTTGPALPVLWTYYYAGPPALLY